MQTHFMTGVLLSVLMLFSTRETAAQSSALGGAITIRNDASAGAARIDPRLFGNFIELLDDVAPGMWAEMLNDRSFEGVRPLANWCYYDGSPDICDREWDKNASWSLDTSGAFNGARCARLAATRGRPPTLTQSGLAAKKGMSYTCSGWFRADDPRLKISATLKAQLPDGEWMTLASAKFPTISSDWKKYSVSLKSSGKTDRAIFELRSEGGGNLWADKLSLMPDNNLRGWRRDVVEAIREVKPGIVRWGGSVCDPGEYRWKNGIGDRDHRTPFPNKVWGRLDPNDVGIDEFCQFCELTGAEALICLSFSDGPESAADLVEYCNGGPETTWGAKRAANGHPSPYRVKYWQVGNEISGDDPAYLQQFPRFAEMMKRKDAGVQLMTSFPGRKLLERNAADIAFICPHHYTPDLEGCDREFNDLARMIEGTPGGGNIRIAVTEWNVSGGDWGLGRGRQQTLSTALENARYLHVMMRHAERVKLACRSNMANSFCGAIIETSPSGVLKRPSYYVMQLYANHARPAPLRVESTVNGVDVFACGSEDRKAVVLFAVNSKTSEVKAKIALDGFAGNMRVTGAESVRDRLNAGQPDVMNHWTAPDRVMTRKLETAGNEVVLPPLSATAIECAAE